MYSGEATEKGVAVSKCTTRSFDAIQNQFSNRGMFASRSNPSGKTEIYIKWIETFLATGKQVLYLLPEIAFNDAIS